MLILKTNTGIPSCPKIPNARKFMTVTAKQWYENFCKYEQDYGEFRSFTREGGYLVTAVHNNGEIFHLRKRECSYQAHLLNEELIDLYY